MKQKKNVYEVISEVWKRRAAMLSELRAKLAEEEANQANADEKANEAINSADAENYTKAKDAGRTAADKIEFYKIQINAAEAAPLFDNPEERKEKAAEIKKHVEDIKAEKMKEAAQLIKEAASLTEDVRNEIIKGNEALKILATNTDSKGGLIDIIFINGLCQKLNGALDHIEIKPYV